jgi:hypothetical protein
MYISLSSLFEYEWEGCPCGVPPHWALTVREFLDDTCNNRWCGRDGPIPWLANSLDLKPPDFFVWGYVKSLVYRQRPQNEADLRQKITAAFAQITPEMLCATWRNLSARYEVCRVRRGGHVE